MKIITVGISPYLLTSQAQIHADTIKHLYLSGYSIASIVKFHDTSYFLPENDENNNPKHFYKWNDHKIPLIPLEPTNQDISIIIYEIIKSYEPDMIITIGDINEFLYMKAVKMFAEKPFKWFAVLMNYTRPINEKNTEIINDMDGILCTNKNSYTEIKTIFSKETIDFGYVGTKFDITNCDLKKENSFRIMVSGKNVQSDNIPTIMQVVKDLRQEIPEIQLYLHVNVHDNGDFDLPLLKERFDPQDEFIKFPKKYVSITDGYLDQEFQDELLCSDIFISIPMNTASAMTVFDAVAMGCLPILNDTPCHREIITLLLRKLKELDYEDMLIPCVELITRSEVLLSICNPEELKFGIFDAYSKIFCKKNTLIQNKKGYRTSLSEFIKDYKREYFMNKISKIIKEISQNNSILCLEQV